MHLVPFVFFLLTACIPAAIYYLDPAGDDSRSAHSPDQAWRSLGKINSVALKPGDQVLFKAGGRWSGQFKPTGSGSAGAPVSIGRYGDGPLPRIDGEGAHLDVVLIRNFSFIELADLEITNQGPSRAAWRTGVRISAEGIGNMQGISLRRLFVHDVNGDLRKDHEGCGIFFEAKGRNGTHFDGLFIEDCHVVRTDRNGICQRGTGRTRSRNVIIRGNLLEDIGGDGINEDTIIRYNISVHDGINSARVFHFGGEAKRTHIYHNTIVIGPHQDLPMILFSEWNDGRARDTRFTNNLFIVENGGRATYEFDTSRGNVFDGNLFAGRHEGLPNGVSISPMPRFAGPLKPAPGFESLRAFVPHAGTDFPVGRIIKDNGGRDFFGKPLPSDQLPAVGAIQP